MRVRRSLELCIRAVINRTEIKVRVIGFEMMCWENVKPEYVA